MKVSDSQTELRKGLQIIADSEDEELVQVIESTPKDPFFYRRTKLTKHSKEFLRTVTLKPSNPSKPY
jgi:hypothetical protein